MVTAPRLTSRLLTRSAASTSPLRPTFRGFGYVAWMTLSLLTAPAFAQEEAEAEDDDDDILAPADDEEKEAAAAPRDTVGFLPLVAVGDAQKPLAEQVTESMVSEFGDAAFAVKPFALAAGQSDSEVDMEQGQDEKAAGDKALKTATKLLRNMSLARAEKAFRAALEKYKKAGPALSNVDPVVNAYVGLGEVFARQGLEDESNQALREAARFNPEAALDPAVYPPQFLRAFETERDNVLSGDKGTIIVDGTARGAMISIDGREIGTAPLKIQGVPAGEHFVRVYQDDVGLYGALVDVAIEDEETVTPGFFKDSGVGPVDLLSQNKFTDEAAAFVAAAAKKEELVGVVVGVINKKTTEVPAALIYIDTETKQVRHLDVLKFDSDLLNMTIESLKAREEIEKTMKSKKLSRVDDEPLLPDVVVTSQLAVPETTLRFDVDGGVAKKKKRRSKKKKRRAGGDDDDDEDDDRKMASAGKKGKRKSLRDEKRGPLEASNESDGAEDDGSLLTSPFLWGGVAGGAILVVGVAAAAGGVAAWYFLIPPSSASVEVVWPE